MENNPAATKMFLNAAQVGELNLLKHFALVLDPLSGDGIAAVIGNTKDGGGRRAVHFAASGGSVEVLKYLIQEMGVDIEVRDGRGETPLSFAAIKGRLAAVEYLLEIGANPEMVDDFNCSPLHHASVKGHNNVIPLLLSKGINVDITNDFGSPLQYAATAGKHNTVKLLLDHGANPNLVFHDTFTPLHASIHSQSWQCVELLLKAGADPNGAPDGIKALPLAAGVTKIIKLLVDAGADPNVKNIRGLKPIELAAVISNREGVEILFPVTSPIPSYDEWSINGITKHVKSKKFKKKMNRKSTEYFLEVKSRGTDAFQRKEYCLAVYWYSKALSIKPGDAAVLSNRSLCYVYLNKGNLAFEDATLCLLEKPDWPKAFFRAGVSLKLLNRLDEAAVAFSDGLKLDSENRELQDALREVTLDRLKAISVQQGCSF
ncbi:hypothetical protein MKW98_000044 [Papaver atlanticum]|uniref:Uncharacterized protein n=1 Tax=Papaver atlanticum TaxID=357466 RepID=A0AAD4S9V8_9MAGN|nr:hypothetical protein MKW98_000044 [Papaver atlanticum]